MRRVLNNLLGITVVVLALVAVSAGQVTTATKVVQNSDGTYTIVEYPIGKETVVTLNPVGLSGATGTATILRAADGTTIKMNLASLPAEVASLNVYAVDPSGGVTMLGSLNPANGGGTFTTVTPLTRFMLLAAPDANLSNYNDSTVVYFRSAAPAGLSIIPLTVANAAGEQVAAVVAPVTTAVVPTSGGVSLVTAGDYVAPLLGIPTFKRGDDTKLKVNFSGAMEGARANIFIEPHKNGKLTEVRMRFHDLKEAPKGQAYVLWASSSDGQMQRLGQVVNVKGRNEAEIKSETALDDFGLFLTVEDMGATQGTIVTPSGRRVGVIEIIK